MHGVEQILPSVRLGSGDPDGVSQEALRVAQTIASACQPIAVLLFGSAAEGKATDQSDLDFVVIVKEEQDVIGKRKLLRKKMPLSSFAVDLIFISEAEFNRKRQLGGVCMVSWEEGRCLYAEPGRESEFTK